MKLIRVRLINACMVKEELAILNKAEKDRNCKSKPKCIMVAKRLVRESLTPKVMPNGESVRYVPPSVVAIYKRTLRDMGQNTFVYDLKMLKSLLAVIVGAAKGAVGGVGLNK